MNYLMNGLAALAFIVLFSQCAGKTDNQTSTTPAQVNAELSGMKIAYVEIDSLLAKYNFCIDLNEAMVKKSENVQELTKYQQSLFYCFRIQNYFIHIILIPDVSNK